MDQQREKRESLDVMSAALFGGAISFLLVWLPLAAGLAALHAVTP